MSTPPDGISPTMQMYLFHAPGATDSVDDFVPTSGAFDASVRLPRVHPRPVQPLVVDANGNSTLNDIQAGAMGEAWSDYYAMDYLVSHQGFDEGHQEARPGLEGKYVAGGQHLIRTWRSTARVGQGQGLRVRGHPRQKGGYMYGDFPNIIGVPEVHASGEIWAQTLWDLRKKLGHTVADSLITRAMSISARGPATSSTCATPSSGPTWWPTTASTTQGHLEGLRQPRHGLLRRLDRRGRHDSRERLPLAAARRRTTHNGIVAGGRQRPDQRPRPGRGCSRPGDGQGYQYAAITDSHGQYEIGQPVRSGPTPRWRSAPRRPATSAESRGTAKAVRVGAEVRHPKRPHQHQA